MLVSSCVYPVAIPRPVFCTICSLSMFDSDALCDHMVEKGNSYRPISLPSVIADTGEEPSWLQKTQPTSGGAVTVVSSCHSGLKLSQWSQAVTVVSSCCANCVEPPRPQHWGPDLPFFGHADTLDGWRCCSQKRVMSRPIQVRQL